MADETLDDFWDFLGEDGFTTPPIPGSRRVERDGRMVTERTPPKTYHVPSPDAATGARMAGLSAIAVKHAAHRAGHLTEDVAESDVAKLRLEGKDERDMVEQCLGSAYDEMVADGVPYEIVTKLGTFAFVYWTQGKSAAEEAARKGVIGGGKVRAPEAAPIRQNPTRLKASRKPTGSTRTSRTTPKS